MDIDAQVEANTSTPTVCGPWPRPGRPRAQAAVLERFFSAHFAEGKALDDIETLQRIGGEAGLDGRRTAAVLASNDYAQQVLETREAAAELGITSVPCFVASRHVALTGAHTVEVMGQAHHRRGGRPPVRGGRPVLRQSEPGVSVPGTNRARARWNGEGYAARLAAAGT